MNGSHSFRRVVLSILPVAILLLAACAPAAPANNDAPRELTVFAAASLTDAFQELASEFESRHPGAHVVFNFAGSQQLAQQLGQGAPADVFASANSRQMQAAIDAGRVVSGTEEVFVTNQLVVITPAGESSRLESLADLAEPGVKLVLAAKEVPVGGYSLEFLEKASSAPDFTAAYSPTVLSNVVSYEENVRAVLSKVALGEADAGIVYSSDAPPSASEVQRIAIPDPLNVIASYPIAAVSDAVQPELARQFVEFVLSPDGQAILAEFGFGQPPK